jgi:hypothetical protein
MYKTCSYSFQVHKQHSPIVELTTEDISAFIIPPPPGGPAASAPGGLRKRSLNPPLFTEREIQEVRVAKDQLEVRAQRQVPTAGSPPKLTTLQERITQLRLNDSAAKLPVKESMGLNLQKDRYGYPIPGSGGGGDGCNLKSPPLRGESSSAAGPLVRRSSMATVGGWAAAETPPTAPRGAALNQQRREVFMRQVSSPDMSSKPFVLVAAEGESPPPPPPRANIPTGFGTLGRRPPPPSTFQVIHLLLFKRKEIHSIFNGYVPYVARINDFIMT